MRVLNRYSNSNPKGASRPLSKSARGFIPSSGAGILILEELNHARQRGAKIIAEIKAGFSNTGGHRNGGSMTFPNVMGVQRCLEQTVAMSGLSVSSIDLINGHLTATKADESEINSWHKLFSGNVPYINASKSIFGHTLVAAGALESIATLLQMKHSFLHANLNSEDMREGIKSQLQYFSSETSVRPFIEINAAIKANFGFGDVNSALIFKKYTNE
jgi:3-oxoacyl-(acyl-carrier-protein) synthase